MCLACIILFSSYCAAWAAGRVTHLNKALPGSFSCAGSRALAAGSCPRPGSRLLSHLYLPAELGRMPLLGLGSLLCLQSPFVIIPSSQAVHWKAIRVILARPRKTSQHFTKGICLHRPKGHAWRSCAAAACRAAAFSAAASARAASAAAAAAAALSAACRARASFRSA